MLVRATQVGFYDGSRRRVGAVFEVPAGTSGKWFVPVGDAEAKAEKPKAKAKAKGRGEDPATLSEIARLDAEDCRPKGIDDPV